MKYRLLPVLALCAALLVSPALAEEKKRKPTPEELLPPAPVSVAPVDCAKAYDDILKADGANLAALNGRAMCKNLMKYGSGAADLQKAIDLASAQIKADDKNAEAYYSRATSYRVLQDYTKAKEDYTRAVQLKPDQVLWAADLETLNAEITLHEQLGQTPPKKEYKDPVEELLEP